MQNIFRSSLQPRTGARSCPNWGACEARGIDVLLEHSARCQWAKDAPASTTGVNLLDRPQHERGSKPPVFTKSVPNRITPKPFQAESLLVKHLTREDAARDGLAAGGPEKRLQASHCVLIELKRDRRRVLVAWKHQIGRVLTFGRTCTWEKADSVHCEEKAAPYENRCSRKGIRVEIARRRVLIVFVEVDPVRPGTTLTRPCRVQPTLSQRTKPSRKSNQLLFPRRDEHGYFDPTGSGKRANQLISPSNDLA